MSMSKRNHVPFNKIKKSQIYFCLAFFVLLISLFSLQLMSWWAFWGLDFHNLYQFHTQCGHAWNPYEMTGKACGDVSERDMYYPPLLYWTFVWIRLFPYPVAISIWSVIFFVSFGIAIWAWARSSLKNWQFWVLVVLTVFQLPTVFALERGNNDIIILILWTFTFLAYRTQREWTAGFLASLAVQAKIYPAIAFAVLGVGTFRSPRIFLGAISGFCLGALVFWIPLRTYLFVVFPQLSRWRNAPDTLNHHLLTRFPQEWMAYGVLGALAAIWALVSLKKIKTDPAFVFAGALAIATYYTGSSNDYALITTYPLLWLLCDRSFQESKPCLKTVRFLSILGFVALMLRRPMQVGSYSVALQVIWLFATAALGLLEEKKKTALIALSH